MAKKPFFLVIATIFFGALFFIILKNSINFFDYKSISYWLRIIVFFGFYGSLAVLSVFLLKMRIYLIEVLGITLLYWFIFGFNEIYLAAGLGFLFLNFIYATKVIKEKEERINFSVRRIIYPKSTLFIISLIILVSVGYYFLPSIQTKAEMFEIPSNVREGVENLSYNFFIKTAPEDFISQSGEKGGVNVYIQKVVAQALGWLNFLAEPYLEYFPIVLASGVFLLLSAFTWLWKIIIIIFTSVIFKVFRKTGFVKIELAQKQVEQVRL